MDSFNYQNYDNCAKEKHSIRYSPPFRVLNLETEISALHKYAYSHFLLVRAYVPPPSNAYCSLWILLSF